MAIKYRLAFSPRTTLWVDNDLLFVKKKIVSTVLTMWRNINTLSIELKESRKSMGFPPKETF